MSASVRLLLAGFAWAVLAVFVWSGSLVMLRLGVSTSLSAYDLTAIRIGVAALLLCSVVVRHGLAVNRLGGAGLLLLVTGQGAPYILLLSIGLHHTSAGVVGALNPGLMAVFTLLGGWLLWQDRPGLQVVTGALILLTGVALCVALDFDPHRITAYLLLCVSAGLWSSYTLVMRRARLTALHATAIVATLSALIYLPFYATVLPVTLFAAPAADVIVQGLYQGVLTSVVALYAFNRSIEALGTRTGAALPALIPLVTLVMGAVLLGESMTGMHVAGAVLTSIGVGTIFLHRRVPGNLS